MRTCSRWQSMCSSSGISRLRLLGGRASKSRWPGHFDETFIPLNRVWCALVPRGRSDAGLHPSVQRDETRHARKGSAAVNHTARFYTARVNRVILTARRILPVFLDKADIFRAGCYVSKVPRSGSEGDVARLA